MTVKGLIEVLLGFDMRKEIYIADNVEFEDEKNGKINGSGYEIENIKEGACAYLEFDNRNHFRVKEKEIYSRNDVLRGIREEIEQLPTDICEWDRRIYINASEFKENVLTIIDKYLEGVSNNADDRNT